MRVSQAPSITRKLTTMNLLVTAAALVLACAAFIGYDRITFENAMVRNVSIQAQIVGSNSVSALLFNDPDAAKETLSALKAAPTILSAAVYTDRGQQFASYLRDSNVANTAFPSVANEGRETHWIDGDQIVLMHPIVFQGKRTGVVYIRSSLDELNRRERRYLGIAAIVLLGCLFAALLMSSIFRRSVAGPIVDLAQLAHVVSRDRNYSVRAKMGSTYGELNILISAFNEMLAEIQHTRDDLENRVEQRTAELQRANKFKDQFLSTMSHELRTPLNAVLGFSDLLTEERYGPLNDRQKRYIGHIQKGGKHLLSLINDILDLSKIEAGRLQLAIDTVKVSTSVSEALDSVRPLADKKSQKLVHSAASALSVRADATRLKQVLMNLVGNAIKFTPEGGTIEVAAKKDDKNVRIEVRDSGPGIPPEEQKRIFEAFYRLRQTDKAAEGTGLGLAITQRLVELHGGQLGIESEVSSGSCFYFTLPSVPTIEAQDRRASAVGLERSAPARIVVIDDDPAAAHLLQSHLASAGYQVEVCQQAQLAVEMVALLQPDAVTMDLVMQPINGWELLSNLRSDTRTAHIPVVMVTVVDQPATGALLGADEYVIKPIDKVSLFQAVDRCLRKRGSYGQAQSVLIVEDDLPTREFVRELFLKERYVVSVAANGAEARAEVKASRPDIVILDLILPDVSGFQLIAEWRCDAHTIDMPIFVLTSKDLTTEEKRYVETNTGALFQKHDPWPEALLKQLRRALSPVTVEKS